jgi:polyphosphate kinase
LTDEEKIVGRTLKSAVTLTEEELASVNSRPGLVQLLSHKNVDVRKALVKLRYEQELQRLQIELVQLQRDIQINGRRVAILFEGRDAAGKGGTIRRFAEHLNPRTAKVAALAAPPRWRRVSGTSSAIRPTCPTPARSCSSTAVGTTGRWSNR